MDTRELTLTPHPEAPDVLCGPDGLRIFIGTSLIGSNSCKGENRTAVAKRLMVALRLVEGLSTGEIEIILEAKKDTPMVSGRPNVANQAVIDVFEERKRQVSELGWTLDHDDAHDGGELAAAAACYAQLAHSPKCGLFIKPDDWPWHEDHWSPSTPRRMLVKSGALILAEIERLDRMAARTGGES